MKVLQLRMALGAAAAPVPFVFAVIRRVHFGHQLCIGLVGGEEEDGILPAMRVAGRRSPILWEIPVHREISCSVSE